MSLLQLQFYEALLFFLLSMCIRSASSAASIAIGSTAGEALGQSRHRHARGNLPWLLNARWKKAFAAATSRLARSTISMVFPSLSTAR